jgi:hypothetical protein
VDRHQGATLTMVILAGAINVYGAIKASRTPTPAVVGTVILGAVLMGVAGPAPIVGESLALAYLITSFTANGSDVLAAVEGLTGGTGSAPPTSSPPPTGGGGGRGPAAQ